MGQATGVELGGQHERADAGAAQAQLERLRVQRVDVAGGTRIEDQDALGPCGRGRDALGGGQPAGRPAPGEAELGGRRLPLRPAEAVDRGKQDLLHGPLDGAHRKALLQDPVCLELLEAAQRGAQARRRRRAAAALAGDRDRRGHVVRLLEGLAQRLDL